jgi:hypothetical protein
VSTQPVIANQPPAAPNQNLKDYWAEIEHEISQALGRSQITKEAVKHVKVEVETSGVILSGEVFFAWERDVANIVVKAHNHGLVILNRVRIWGQTRARHVQRPAPKGA